jgi:hypothetical protein
MPWTIVPRRDMPQIDHEDMTALVEWLAWKGIALSHERIDASELQFRQRIDLSLTASMDDETYGRPIWISRDRAVLDGNHRGFEHKVRAQPVDCFVIDLDFEDAVAALFSFAGTYDYAKVDRRVA